MPHASKIAVITSFSPHRIEAQRRAVASWRRLGFDVLALHAADEAARIQLLFPDVRVVNATRDARNFLKKPCVFVRDLAKAVAESGATLCGIINADVELSDDDSLPRAFTRLANGALVFGSRVDYSMGREAEGVTYALGYDYFFFEPAFAARIPDEPFCLGAPWWDYWLPAIGLELGVPIRRLTSRVAFHERHDAAYSHEIWMMYAALMGPRMEPLELRPLLTPQAQNAVRDIGKRSIRIAEKYREHIERLAESVSLDTPST